MTDQEARSGWVDEDGLWWCVRISARHPGGLWLAGESSLLTVYQAVGDVQFGLSIQMDARLHPAEAPLEPPASFVDWMWNVS